MRELCDSLAAGILKICEANNTKIACAESLTGGLLADAFVRIPGASNVAWPAPVRTVTSRPDWCMWACASPQASPRTMPKCSKPSNSILMACAKRFVASPYSTFCKT